MRFVCLWSPRWSTGGAPLAEIATALLEEAPRVAVEARGLLWADARGLPGHQLALSLLARLGSAEVHAGLADVPVAAELAARSGETPLTIVEAAHERAFLASLPLALLEPSPRIRPLLEGVGLLTCGDLAALSREAVEVRLGAEGARLWRLARGDDPRPIFRPIPWERPHASMEFVDYQVTDAARLVFTLHALLGSVCETLQRRAERCRLMVLSIALGSGTTLRRELRCPRPTAERGPWLERIRQELERLILPDTVTGVGLEATEQEPVSATQGDLFDRGFATAAPVEEAVSRLVGRLGPVFARPSGSDHPLAEARTAWTEQDPEAVAATSGEGNEVAAAGPCLALQLLSTPKPVLTRSRSRRDHVIPIAFRERRRWSTIREVAGPDRVSGGHDSEAFAREYFRCVTDEGRLVWLYRDAREGGWYLHGWWD